MIYFYRDYYWKMGKPQGLQRITDDTYRSGTAYKIIVDPYYKRFSVERYHDGSFVELAYDSAVFDFRLLKPVEQNAWLKESIDEMTSLIRNQDDRVIIKEVYSFEEGLCRECRTYYPNGELISIQKISYKKLGDAINGVDLFDRSGRLIVHKEYKANDSGEFTEMLKEEWDMTPARQP